MLWVCVLGFIAANAASSVVFKYAAERQGSAAFWMFALGNVIGVFAPVALMFGLRRGNPNMVYAFCYGGAFAVLQFASWGLFKQPLTALQWLGILSVGLGICLLEVGKQ
jgi:multidrug transporter EmrE-like cation transporter